MRFFLEVIPVSFCYWLASNPMRFFLEAIPVYLYLSAVLASIPFIWIGEVSPASFCYWMTSNPMRFFLEVIPVYLYTCTSLLLLASIPFIWIGEVIYLYLSAGDWPLYQWGPLWRLLGLPIAPHHRPPQPPQPLHPPPGQTVNQLHKLCDKIIIFLNNRK